MDTRSFEKNYIDDTFVKCSNHFLEEITVLFLYFPSLLKDLARQLRSHEASTLVCITKNVFPNLSHKHMT